MITLFYLKQQCIFKNCCSQVLITIKNNKQFPFISIPLNPYTNPNPLKLKYFKTFRVSTSPAATVFKKLFTWWITTYMCSTWTSRLYMGGWVGFTYDTLTLPCVQLWTGQFRFILFCSCLNYISLKCLLNSTVY